jgi:outer membrane protein TolC
MASTAWATQAGLPSVAVNTVPARQPRLVEPADSVPRIAAVAPTRAPGATPAPPASIDGVTSLDAYVALGLQRNLARKQQQLGVRRADAAVREVRGQFLPSATFNAQRIEVVGNRIDLGQFINPAFSALNGLLQRPQFPTDIALQLPLRQTTSVRLAQPLFQPQLLQAYRIASALRDVNTATLDQQSRTLAADIRKAYLDYARASQVVEIYASTHTVLDEAVRVAERLVANGKATPDVVYRARADRAEIVQKEADARQTAIIAGEAFNLLLDRPLETPVSALAESALGIDSLTPLDDALQSAASRREELRQLADARRATAAQRQLERARFLPSVSVALDYGVQGNQYRFDRRNDFTQTAVVVSWNLFNGAQDMARVEQASLELDRVDARRREAERSIQLDVRQTHSSALVGQSAIATSVERLEAARRTFELVQKKYEQGLASQLEFLDARNTWTTAALNRVLTTYDYYQRAVQFARAAALYPRN